jgi:stage V sporulation protein G
LEGEMVISAAKVTPVNKMNLLAVASITLSDCFVLRAMRLVKGSSRRYVAMPTRQTGTGRVFEVYHPITVQARQVLEELIFDGYDQQMSGRAFEPALPIYLGSRCEDFAISSVRVKPYDEPKLRGFASMVLDDCLVVNGIKLILGKNRRFVQMPNVRKKTGRFRDLAFPTQPRIRDLIEQTVFDEFKKVCEGA